jgi:acetoacetyl-CoA reductase
MGRVALVTGGSRGIGEAISKALQAEGYTVAATYAGNDEKAAAFTAETGIKTYKWNVADYDSLQGRASPRSRPISARSRCVVANAGITRDAHVPPDDAGEWNEVIDTNLTGVFNTVHPVWPGMRERKFGRVIVISSINGQKGQAGQVNYAATKAGDLGIVKVAGAGRRAGRHHRQRHLPRLHRDGDGARDPEDVLNSKIIPQIPAGRLGEPEEIARCVVFLASDDAGFINGSTISANDGKRSRDTGDVPQGRLRRQ